MLAGPGVLGSYLGKLWMERFPSAKVVGQTNSDTSHDRCEHQRYLYYQHGTRERCAAFI